MDQVLTDRVPMDQVPTDRVPMGQVLTGPMQILEFRRERVQVQDLILILGPSLVTQECRYRINSPQELIIIMLVLTLNHSTQLADHWGTIISTELFTAELILN